MPRWRGIPVVLDADEPRHDGNALLTLVSHVVFSAEGLRATAGTDHLGRALIDVAKQTTAFVAVTDGANDVLWLADGELRQIPAFKVDVVDTLGAGDTFHGAFTLMLAEGISRSAQAMRFCGGGGGAQMHPLWRHPGRADTRGGRGVSGEAGRSRRIIFSAPKDTARRRARRLRRNLPARPPARMTGW